VLVNSTAGRNTWCSVGKWHNRYSSCKFRLKNGRWLFCRNGWQILKYLPL